MVMNINENVSECDGLNMDNDRRMLGGWVEMNDGWRRRMGGDEGWVEMKKPFAADLATQFQGSSQALAWWVRGRNRKEVFLLKEVSSCVSSFKFTSRDQEHFVQDLFARILRA